MLRARKSQPIGGLSIAKYNGISMIITFARMRMIKHKKRLHETAVNNVASQRAVKIEGSSHTRVVLGHLNACGPSKGMSKRAYSREVQPLMQLARGICVQLLQLIQREDHVTGPEWEGCIGMG